MEPLSEHGLPRLSWIDTLYGSRSFESGVLAGDGGGLEEEKKTWGAGDVFLAPKGTKSERERQKSDWVSLLCQAPEKRGLSFLFFWGRGCNIAPLSFLPLSLYFPIRPFFWGVP